MSALFVAFALIGLIIGVYICLRISKDPLLGVCMFVFGSSVTMMPNLPIVGDRLAVADFIMVYTILVCVISGVFFSSAPLGLKLVDQFALLFISVATISSLLALMKGGEPLRVTLFMLIYLYGYCCFRLIIRIIRNRRDLERVAMWWFAGTALAVSIGFLASTGIFRPAWTFDPIIGRINSTFKMSGQLASYVGPAMFILLYLAASKRVPLAPRLLVICLFLAGLVVLLGAGSRIAFVVMVFAGLAGVWIVGRSRLREFSRAPLLIAFASAALAFSVFVVAIWTDTSTSYGLTTTPPFERAVKLWSEQFRSGPELSTLGGTRYDEVSAVLENFWDHPFVGTGSGMFGLTYNMNEVHNTYFSVLAENGLFAFIILVSWWTLILFLLSKAIHRTRGEARVLMRFATAAFIVISIYQLTTNGMRQRPFWFVPALALSAAAVVPRDLRPDNSLPI